MSLNGVAGLTSVELLLSAEKRGAVVSFLVVEFPVCNRLSFKGGHLFPYPLGLDLGGHQFTEGDWETLNHAVQFRNPHHPPCDGNSSLGGKIVMSIAGSNFSCGVLP